MAFGEKQKAGIRMICSGSIRFLRRRRNGRIKCPFSDLLRVSTELLREMNGRNAEGSAPEKAEESFYPQWIIVDEVQDSDALQMDFLAALREYSTRYGGARLFAVGDPNQVIYSWRGTGENMFFLLKHRFEARELTLPVNYRSGGAILEAAGHFLQFGGGIQGSRETGAPVVVKNHYDPFPGGRVSGTADPTDPHRRKSL